MNAAQWLALGVAVTRHLGPGWTATEEQAGSGEIVLCHDDGSAVILTEGRKRGTYTAEGVYVQAVYDAAEGQFVNRHAVGMPMANPPDVIAANITRRLLPAYRETLAMWLAVGADRKAAATRTAEMMARIAAAAGRGAPEPGYMVDLRGPSGFRGHVSADRVGQEGAVDIDLHGVPEAMAAQLMAVVYRWTR